MSIKLVVVGEKNDIKTSLFLLQRCAKTTEREKKKRFGAFAGEHSNSLRYGCVTVIDVQQVWHTCNNNNNNNKAQKIRFPLRHELRHSLPSR